MAAPSAKMRAPARRGSTIAEAMPKRHTLRSMLTGGPRLGAGRVCEVVELVLAQPRKIPQLVECLWDDDPAVANRAADVLERVTRDRPERAQPWKDPLLGLIAEALNKKVEKKLRWNLALVVPRLKLTVPECRRTAALLQSWLDDPSSIVKTAALHGIADLTRQDPSSLPAAIELLQIAGRSGTPAMRARSRILLKELESNRQKRSNQSSLHMFD
jgi:hypothetical protein